MYYLKDGHLGCFSGLSMIVDGSICNPGKLEFGNHLIRLVWVYVLLWIESFCCGQLVKLHCLTNDRILDSNLDSQMSDKTGVV